MVVSRALPGRRAPPPPALSSLLIRIQTDAGRRSDSSIRHNRIVERPFPVRRPCPPLLAGSLLAAALASLLVAEHRGFLAVPFAATDRKYLGRAPQLGRNASSADALHDDEFGGADDDAAQDASPDGARGTADEDAASEDADSESPSGDESFAVGGSQDQQEESPLPHEGAPDEREGPADDDAQRMPARDATGGAFPSEVAHNGSHAAEAHGTPGNQRNGTEGPLAEERVVPRRNATRGEEGAPSRARGAGGGGAAPSAPRGAPAAVAYP